MFGYVTINKPEMKFKEFDIYHAYYCGLCHTLKKQFGNITRLTLNNDLTFIAILLSSLYEVETKKKKVVAYYILFINMKSILMNVLIIVQR